MNRKTLCKDEFENCEIVKENKQLKEVIETLKETNKLLLKQKGQLQEDLDMLDNRIDKAVDKLYCWGEALQPEFQKSMLGILKGDSNE